MKIRKGFVSNSSSSSFIIAFKDEKVAKVVASLFSTRVLVEVDAISAKKAHNLKFNNIIHLSAPYGGEDMFLSMANTKDFETVWEEM